MFTNSCKFCVQTLHKYTEQYNLTFKVYGNKKKKKKKLAAEEPAFCSLIGQLLSILFSD